MKLHDTEVITINGEKKTLADYAGKTLLIVNTATGCGLTPQFEGLEALHQRFKDRGFAVLGFPCNQFAGQEPLDNFTKFLVNGRGEVLERFAPTDKPEALVEKIEAAISGKEWQGSWLTSPPKVSVGANVARIALGLALLFAGTAHLTFQRSEFLAQVPRWVPLDADFVVLASGVVELLLGASLVALARQRVLVGLSVAAFFVAIFPGNLSQYMNGISAFGLDTDQARFVRLFFQPVLVAWALWSTGAWKAIGRLRQPPLQPTH